MATQKTLPRILTFTKPDNIQGSVRYPSVKTILLQLHGKISAYQEIWNYTEMLRYNNYNLEKDKIKFNARNSVLIQINANIINELKSLGCSEVGFTEKWIDND
jgi:hypothetical protein